MDAHQETNRRIIEQFRAGGPIEGFGREQLLLLTTTGRRTGARRTTPMWFERDEDDLMGVTPELSPFGKILVAAIMFLGRVGPITILVALAARQRPPLYKLPEEGIAIG